VCSRSSAASFSARALVASASAARQSRSAAMLRSNSAFSRSAVSRVTFAALAAAM
jgi:hypothetical protein